MHGRGRSYPLLTWLVFQLWLSPASGATLADAMHVRTTDPVMRTAIANGLERSPFFHDLVTQIDASDVIVYVQTECAMPAGLSGSLAFMTSAAGVRYVRIKIACTLDATMQVAMLGHELRHAVEVASAASVVDEASLAAEYRRIGFPSHLLGKRTGFDTEAAIAAGYRVWHELTRDGVDPDIRVASGAIHRRGVPFASGE
jgi:hypothetical protein